MPAALLKHRDSTDSNIVIFTPTFCAPVQGGPEPHFDQGSRRTQGTHERAPTPKEPHTPSHNPMTNNDIGDKPPTHCPQKTPAQTRTPYSDQRLADGGSYKPRTGKPPPPYETCASTFSYGTRRTARGRFRRGNSCVTGVWVADSCKAGGSPDRQR